MKKIFSKWILCLPVLLALGSCKKDYLDRSPLNSFSDDQVWSDINLVQAYVNSKYEGLPNINNNQPTAGNGLMQSLAPTASDDDGYSKFNWFGESIITTGQLTPDQDVLDVWGPDYTYIQYCNIFFQKIGSVPVTVGQQALKSELIGEMKFIRAYMYLDLIQHYGGVPIITQVYSLNDTTFSVARSTYDECVSQIVQDADSAAALLPAVQDAANWGRANSVAALALKARVLLYAASPLNNTGNDVAKWQAAADASLAAITAAMGNGYSLYQGPDYRNIFLDKQNPEIIFSWNENNLPGTGIDLWCSPNSYNGWSTFEPTQHLVDQFEMANGTMITDPASGYDSTNPYVDREPRFYADILYNGSRYTNVGDTNPGDTVVQMYAGGKDSPAGPQGWNASNTGYNWMKYMDETQDLNLANGTQNWILFRLGELFLDYAEAENALGMDGPALTYLNQIRTRASVNLPAVAATGTALRDKIRHEREIELCFEAHRIYDIRRWMIAPATCNQPAMGVSAVMNGNGTVTYTPIAVQQRLWQNAFYLWPINRTETRKNPKLVQNPGYN